MRIGLSENRDGHKLFGPMLETIAEGIQRRRIPSDRRQSVLTRLELFFSAIPIVVAF
jgi:hypothetical protein